jgi:hypothetical protein
VGARRWGGQASWPRGTTRLLSTIVAAAAPRLSTGQEDVEGAHNESQRLLHKRLREAWCTIIVPPASTFFLRAQSDRLKGGSVLKEKKKGRPAFFLRPSPVGTTLKLENEGGPYSIACGDGARLWPFTVLLSHHHPLMR